ncbi:MAG: GNAT family N-acetyltransferase [Burkholderiales bacterium]|nr:GNAT family N-acetyltransferase [Burkholderiales bacterium]
MTVVEYPDAIHLAREVEPILELDPANNTHSLSALKRIFEHGAQHDERFYAVVEAGDRVVGCAVRVDSKNLFLSVMSHAAAELLAAHLAIEQIELAGVVGRRDTVMSFVERYGRDYETHANLMLYRLEGQPQFGPAPGMSRIATQLHFDQVLAWYAAFEREVGMIAVPTPLNRRVERRIADEQVVLWMDHGEPVSMACCNGLPANSARVGPVYTPPRLRGRGFAQAVTAAASLHVQRDRARTVFLFTDALNPASNRCYQRIGYQYLSDHLHLLFTGDPGTS